MRDEVAGTRSERQLWLMYALVGMTIVVSALVVWGNVPRMSAWLLVLLAAGIGQAVLLPTVAGCLGGLVVLAAWVLFREQTGTWQLGDSMQPVLELVGLCASVALAIWFRQTWAGDKKHLNSLQPLRTLVADHEGVSGLVSRQVAELRLAVEMERARSFGHPLGVILFEVTPRTGSALREAEVHEAYRAVARQLSNEVESYDTPFADGANRTGVIVPERSPDELRQLAESIAGCLAATVLIDAQGFPQPVAQALRLDCGLATYQGEAVESKALMQAAEESLRLSCARPEEAATRGEVDVVSGVAVTG